MIKEHASTMDFLRSYIREELLNDEDIQIENDQDLLMSGLLDSMNVVRLASHIESEFGFNIPPDDMVIDYFGTVSQISSYIQSRA